MDGLDGFGKKVSQTCLCLPKSSHLKFKGQILCQPVPILGKEDLVS